MPNTIRLALMAAALSSGAAFRPMPTGLQPHRDLPGRVDNLPAEADPRSPPSSEIITASRGRQRRWSIPTARRRRRLHRHHRPEGAEGRAASSSSTASRPRSRSSAARPSSASTPPRARPSRPGKLAVVDLADQGRSTRPAISAASPIRSPSARTAHSSPSPSRTSATRR